MATPAVKEAEGRECLYLGTLLPPVIWDYADKKGKRMVLGGQPAFSATSAACVYVHRVHCLHWIPFLLLLRVRAVRGSGGTSLNLLLWSTKTGTLTCLYSCTSTSDWKTVLEICILRETGPTTLDAASQLTQIRREVVGTRKHGPRWCMWGLLQL